MVSVAQGRSGLWKEQDSRSQNQDTELDREHPSHQEAGHHKVPVFHDCVGARLVGSGEFQAQACRNLEAETFIASARECERRPLTPAGMTPDRGRVRDLGKPTRRRHTDGRGHARSQHGTLGKSAT